MPQLEPLTDQQLSSVYNLRHSCQQAEDALSQGVDKLQQTLAQSIAVNYNMGPGNYGSEMKSEIPKLEALEGFLNHVIYWFLVKYTISYILLIRFLMICHDRNISMLFLVNRRIEKGKIELVISEGQTISRDRHAYMLNLCKHRL